MSTHITTIAAYIAALTAGQTATVSGLCGRLIRGKKPEDFLTLTDDPTRRVVMPMDETGMQSLLGLSGYNMLLTVGYEADYICRKVVDEGNQFRLVVFPAGQDALLGTWDNVVEVVKAAYSDMPAIGERLERHLPELRQMNHQNFPAFQQRVGFVLTDVDKTGSGDARYMTVERYLQSSDTADNARIFLYFTLHLRELFAGDGITRQPDGQKGVSEYLMANKAIATLIGAQVCDIDVQIPQTTQTNTSKNEGPNIMAKTTPEHAPLIWTPKFWDPTKANRYGWSPDISGAYQEGALYALKVGLQSAHARRKAGVKNAAMLVDLEEDFRDKGRLPVIGTDAVVLRMCARLINGTIEEHYSGLVASQDGHPENHRSFDRYWRDAKGVPLDLSVLKAAIFTLEDRKQAVFKAVHAATGDVLGYYQAHFDPQDTVAYWDHLQATGQGPIWVFATHCVLRTDGVNMHPMLAETISFMSGALSMEPQLVFKGHLSDTDWFGAFSPCRPDTSHPQGGFQKDVIEGFKEFDTVEFAGVAEDFCVYHTKQQALDALAGTLYLEKFRFISDGTAPIVPGATHVAAQNNAALASGVKFINTDTPFGKV